MFTTFREYCCDRIEALCILLKGLSYPYRSRYILVPTKLPLIFNEKFKFAYHYHLARLESGNLISFTNTIFSEICRYSYWKGVPLYNCLDFVDGRVSRICRPILNEIVVYNGHARVHGVNFQSLFLPNGLIINLVGPSEDQRPDCVLYSMNRV